MTYSFELTTNSFNVDSDGYIYVNEEKLDRDPPNPGKYRFQVNNINNILVNNVYISYYTTG